MIFKSTTIGCLALIMGAGTGFPSIALAGNTVTLDVAIGKACWIEAYTNSAATWTMTISNGRTTAAVLQGKGVNFAPMKVVNGNARITVKAGVQAKFTSTTGTANVKIQSATINNAK